MSSWALSNQPHRAADSGCKMSSCLFLLNNLSTFSLLTKCTWRRTETCITRCLIPILQVSIKYSHLKINNHGNHARFWAAKGFQCNLPSSSLQKLRLSKRLSSFWWTLTHRFWAVDNSQTLTVLILDLVGVRKTIKLAFLYHLILCNPEWLKQTIASSGAAVSHQVCSYIYVTPVPCS